MQRLSVLLPVYNAEKYIGAAIKSILAQSFTDFELIIADDGSTDQSKAAIARFNDPRIRLSHNEQNQGKVKTVNRLLEMATGEYFTVHDADDLSAKERFEKQVQFLDENPDMAMCGTSFREIDEKGRHLRDAAMITDWESIKNGIINESQFHGPTLIIRRNIPEQVGGFYRDFFIVAEDIEFCVRVCEKYKAVNLPDYLYLYRLLNTSITKNWKNFTPQRIAVMDLLKYLQEERKQFGIDSFQSGKLKEIETVYNGYVNNWNKKWSQIYELGISRSIYFGFWKDSYMLAISWIKKEPLNYKTYKTLLYIIKCHLKRVF